MQCPQCATTLPHDAGFCDMNRADGRRALSGSSG